MAKEVRVRFAPSPTGYLHVGGARTALFNYLFAQHEGGKFLLRIEDTDRERLVADAEEQIKNSLTWLGIRWDGEVRHQSECLETYKEYATELLNTGHAYESEGAIRFKWPNPKPVVKAAYFTSPKRTNERRFDPETTPSAFEDFVLMKSDGYPTYNFAHVIDDHEQGITHVIRGDEFTSSLNKYVALHQALGWQPPQYNHVPPILGPDGSKLSKRHGAADVLEYKSAGYLPEAVANFLALIGWSPGGDRELFFSPEDLAEAFTLDGIQPSPGVFDETKLKWMNKQHMQNRDEGELMAYAEAEGFWPLQGHPQEAKIFRLASERAETLSDLKPDEVGYFFKKPQLRKSQLLGDENLETVGVWLERTQRDLSSVKDWSAERIQGALKDILNELDLVPKQLYPVLREALTGAPQTPAIWDMMEVLGKDESLARLESAAALVS